MPCSFWFDHRGPKTLAAVVMSLTQWCCRPKVGDGFWISAIEFRCWGNLWFVYFWSDLCDHDRLTSVSQICHQHIWSPTCVTNIDVGLLTPHLVQYKIWKGFAMRIVQNHWLKLLNPLLLPTTYSKKYSATGKIRFQGPSYSISVFCLFNKIRQENLSKLN